jgi:hypothetical protein
LCDGSSRRRLVLPHQVRGNPTPVQVIVGEHDPALSPVLME